MKGAQEFDIKLPETGARRIFAGISWEYAYPESGSGTLPKEEVIKGKIRDFPKVTTGIFYILAAIIAAAVYLQVLYILNYPFNETHFVIVMTVTTVIFFFLVYKYAQSPISTLTMTKDGKAVDGQFRDKDFGHFDIDLHCFIYDRDKNFLLEVAPDDKKLVSPEGAVYHSGDDTDGLGSYDDETIHIETAKIPDEYAYFVFCVSNDCKYEFDKIPELKVRLGNSLNDETILSEAINSPHSDGYAFCVVFNENDQWKSRKIGEYLAFERGWERKVAALLG